MDIEHGGNWLVIGDFAMVAYESHNPDLSDDELYERIEQMARTLHDAPDMAQRIVKLEQRVRDYKNIINEMSPALVNRDRRIAELEVALHNLLYEVDDFCDAGWFPEAREDAKKALDGAEEDSDGR